ncbi:MAG: hypothetical protein JRF54_03665 [Deltaproteobacteria bacterium]|nr:hypothetical protein [Deltaproteobacteria bacterium]
MRYIIWAFILFAAAACSAHVRTVRLSVHATQAVSVAPIELERGGSKLTAVGSYKVGKYKDRDLRVLQKMLEKTIPVRGSPEDTFQIHLVMRRILIAHSNNDGAAIACVAWALTSPGGELIFDEQFYAARVAPPLSVNGIKNRIHEAITKRVHDRAQEVASGLPFSPPPEDTYDEYERAASRVPNRFKSEIPTILGGYDKWGGQVGIWRTVSGSSGEGFAQPSDHINWYRRLGIPAPADMVAPVTQPAPPPEAPPSTTLPPDDPPPPPPGYPVPTVP